jgi:hypothetical protein
MKWIATLKSLMLKHLPIKPQNLLLRFSLLLLLGFALVEWVNHYWPAPKMPPPPVVQVNKLN